MIQNRLSITSYNTPIRLIREQATYRANLHIATALLTDLNKFRTSFLHPKEQDYYEALLHPTRQKSYLLGRFCAKQAISAYTNNLDLRACFIENGVFEHPVVHLNYDHNLQVSISHSDELGAAIIFPEVHPLAIDVETVCIKKMLTIKSQMTVKEMKLSNLFSSNAEIWGLTMLWTAKEALSKILKCGLMISFELLEVETIIRDNNYIVSTFKNFPQYKAISFSIEQTICTLVCPKNTLLKVDMPLKKVKH
jgi:4'-phosphopantetheinyl transferase